MSTIMKTFVLAALAATTTAHMVPTEPKPFLNSIGGVSYDDPENSPLADDGSNYPCKMVGDYTADFTNEYELGSSQTLAFMGSAVHGGGSCQVSITYDESPTKQSVFKVIHSIEGGCPAKNTAGNLSPSSNTLIDPDSYSFNVPDNIPAGKGVVAWTWFNRIGNREMYMTCAPVTLTGTGGSIDNYNALPDIMVANIGEDLCEVGEGNDVAFPNPGDSVDQFPFSDSYQDVSDQEACSYNWMAGTGQGSSDGPTDGGDSGDDSTATAPAATSAPAETASATVPGGVFITQPAGSSSTTEAAAPTTTEVAADPAVTAPAATTTEAAAEPTATAYPSAGTGSGGGSGGSGGSACSTEGAFYCTGTGYQQCASGTWTAVRDLAAGTQCTPGEGMSLDISATKHKKGKRAFAFRA
ncbi:hypothetical protein MKZ38_008745 [Zalerion maritima]|uniref:Uncharacterized protein n=1 Tax=Zalerion maritima TaxID=339359 RepID=A0AAD5RHP5_9PEZI|nr:hypothetical protein MKZ38_008745 [Zalerion maritima]